MVSAAQLPLPFPHTPALTEADFLPHPGIELALDFLATPGTWPERRLLLWGGHGSGKSHLLHVWAGANGATLLRGGDLAEPIWPDRPVALDDADQVANEEALLHLLNAAAQAGQPVLLTASAPPARLPIGLPDLASRLRATAAIPIGPADDAFLHALFARLLADRQLPVKPELQGWLLARLPRHPAALQDAVARLDQATLAAKSAVTPALAQWALHDLLQGEPEFSA